MSLSKFFGFFAKSKVNNVGLTLAEKLAQYDPETATAAGMMELERNLDEMLAETAKARQEYQREQQEATVARNNLNQLVSAAKRLGQELESLDPATDRYKQVSKSLTTALDRIDQVTPDVEREEREAKLAADTLQMLEQASNECASQLREAKSQFESSKRELAAAKASEKLAERTAERAAKVAGIRSSGSQMSVAVSALQKATDQSRARADAALQKAALLEKPTAPGDELLDSMLGAASEMKPTDPMERLKNLG